MKWDKLARWGMIGRWSYIILRVLNGASLPHTRCPVNRPGSIALIIPSYPHRFASRTIVISSTTWTYARGINVALVHSRLLRLQNNFPHPTYRYPIVELQCTQNTMHQALETGGRDIPMQFSTISLSCFIFVFVSFFICVSTEFNCLFAQYNI